jgi:hypothetical protein
MLPPRPRLVFQEVRCCSFPRICDRQRIGYLFSVGCLRICCEEFRESFSVTPPTCPRENLQNPGLRRLIIRILSHDR